ncbi:putative quinol monooxygenase [Lentzea sp. NPDC003310]|uniref:putative quinol monooxygenase n=1 Tax=Lentzea sp. NPDC003310 TaxID=3154447 RepID=UPI00339F938D
MIALTVSLRVRPGHREPFLAAIARQAERTFTDEPGCVQFDVAVDGSDDHHFVFYELYTDQAALDAHRTTPHFTAWREAAGEHVVPGSQTNTTAERLLHHA